MTIDPGSVILNSFEISEEGKKIAFATLPYAPISSHIQQAQNSDEIEAKQGIIQVMDDLKTQRASVF